MSKRIIDSGEWFPVYFFASDTVILDIEKDPSFAKYFNEIEMTDEEVARVTKVFADFKEVQKYLQTKIKEQQ